MSQNLLKELFEYQMNDKEKEKVKEIAKFYNGNFENCRLKYNSETGIFAFENKLPFSDKDILISEKLIYREKEEGYMVVAKIVIKTNQQEDIEYSMDPIAFPTDNVNVVIEWIKSECDDEEE